MSSETIDKVEWLNGAQVAEQIKMEVGREVERLRERGVQPCLAVVRVGADPASAVYVRSKVAASEKLGLRSEHHALHARTTTAELLKLVGTLNARQDVDGILVQLPLPREVDESRVLEAIDPAKDVDGFHPINVGRLVLGQPALQPCTPAGIIELLRRSNVNLSGAHAVVVGRSNIVGRPIAQLLLQQDATVTISHSRTVGLAEVTNRADVLIVAAGRAGLVRGDYIKEGATVIDVGMNRVSDEATARELFHESILEERIRQIRERGYTLTGDVHPREAAARAGKLTPVPGGVGPLTVAMLMSNTLKAAKMRRRL